MIDNPIQPRPATSQYRVAGCISISCHIRHAVAFWLTLALLFCSNAAMAVNYTFPGSMPLACSGSGGTYTCTALTLGLTDTITIASPKPATITINGAFSASNAKVNLAGAVTDLKIIVNGTLTALSGADFNANIQATSVNNPLTTVTYRGAINTTTGIVSLGGSSVVSGAIVTTTGSITLGGTADVLSVNCNCAVSVGGLSHIRGNVVAASVTDNINNVAYDGNIATSGALSLGAGSKVLGSTKSAGTTTLVAGSEVVGCVQASNSSTITLGLLAKAGGVCCGNTSCTNTCVVNNTTNVMPPLCGLLPPTPIATYHMDEPSWNGTTGEVLDTSANAYNATAAKKLLAPALPTTASSTPAIYGSVGTCGYGVFGAGKYVSIPATFPNLAQNLTITAWIKTTDNTTSQRIFVDDQTGLSGYGLSLADGGTGKLRFYRRSPLGLLAFTIDTPNVIQNGNWYFVAVTVDAIGQTGTLYVYDDVGSGTLLASTTGPLGFFGIGDAGTASIGEENALSLETASFTGNIDEINVYNTYLSASDIATARTATHNCPLVNVTPANFNCVVVGGASASGHLYTQLSGTAFNVDVVALKSDATVETGYAAASSKNVTLEWVDGTGSTACASRSALNPAVSQTVTFTSAEAGRKTVSSTISQAYRNLRCRITDANQVPSIVGCSSDNFAVRPTSFTMSTSANADSTGSSTSATPVIKAGTSFTLTAASGVVGYDGTPAIDSSKLSAHTGAVQTGTLTGSFGAANSATGTATGSGFSYSEVGYFRLAANGIYDSSFTAVDSANGDCAAGFTNGSQYACNFGNQAATSYAGRFIPDHFAITQGTATPACSTTFTYYGQDGFNTSFTLNAQNSANTITQNYTGSFAKLTLNSWNNFNFTASGLPAGVSLAASSTAPTGSWLNGTAAINARHQTNRPASPVVTANAIVSAAPTDSDGVTMTSAAVAAATPLRYGRLFIPNAYGSELLPLAIPTETQYWNGLTYIRNQQDSCTVIPASSIAMGNYRNNLAACETQLSVTSNISTGRGALNLSKPGAGNNGSVDLTVNLNTASGTTCNSAVAISATSAALSWLGITSLSSRATFGIYKTPVIYMRENF